MDQAAARPDREGIVAAPGRRSAFTLSRDLAKDWRRWSQAERVVVACFLAALLAQVPILLLESALLPLR
jgi:hypothetical protein